MSYSNYNHTHRRSRISEPSKLLAGSDLFHPTADQRYMLGCIYDLDDGRRFRYCEKDGTTALIAAHVNQACAVTTNWVDEPQTIASGAVAAAVGDKSITLLVQTAPTAHDWDDGYLTVVNGDGERNMYVIKSHTLTTNPVVQIADRGGFRVATAPSGSTASDISILKNKFKDVLVAPANPTNVLVGVNLVAVPVNYFFWAQTRGPCPVECDDTATGVVGDWVMVSTDANLPGAITLIVDNMTAEHPVGVVMDASATSETSLIDLKIE